MQSKERRKLLYKQGVITEKEKRFLDDLYHLISGDGTHNLSTKKEYVRLYMNITIEYSLFLLMKYKIFNE